MIGVVVRNLVLGHRPVHALAEWAAPYDPTLLGLADGETGLLNDDRFGRTLARLFDADRASLLTELTLGMIAEFGIDTAQLHNDSTSITLTGAYEQADSRGRAGKPTPKITWGHNTDHRPDLRQLVWILTVSADGAVPIAYRIADGNTADDPTHIPTWDALVDLTGSTDFLYVADRKLASAEATGHIHARGGRLVTVLPRGRKEDTWLRGWIADHAPDWQEALRLPGRRRGDPDRVWRALESPLPSEQGFRIVWIHSNAKAARDRASRHDRVIRGAAALDELATKLAGPRCRYTDRIAVAAAARAFLDQTGAARWIAVTVTETTQNTYRQDKRGRPGPNTTYRRTAKPRFGLDWRIRDDVVAADAASDGCFPLLSNDTTMTPAQVLAAYRYQPNLEKRHACLKGTIEVAPVWLNDPARIEGLACCDYLALVIHALIERELRAAMAARSIRQLSLYPEDRACKAPTASRVLEIFTGLARHHLVCEGEIVRTFPPELTPLQHQVLDLLGVPTTDYTKAS